jgi:hypothetical protein
VFAILILFEPLKHTVTWGDFAPWGVIIAPNWMKVLKESTGIWRL